MLRHVWKRISHPIDENLDYSIEEKWIDGQGQECLQQTAAHALQMVTTMPTCVIVPFQGWLAGKQHK